MSKRRAELSTAEMGVAEYLADPHEGRRKAEKAGVLLVKDERGTTLLVVSSDRASERLLDL
jgi:hypothetical protein